MSYVKEPLYLKPLPLLSWHSTFVPSGSQV